VTANRPVSEIEPDTVFADVFVGGLTFGEMANQ
jgi:hypothetical protein